MRAPLAVFMCLGLLMTGTAGCGGATSSQTHPARSVGHLANGATPAHGTVAVGPRKIRMVLDFIPTGYQAPFYLGIKDGVYRKYGIDLSIVVGSGSAAAIQELGSGQFPVGFADATTSAIGISHGLPLTVVADFLQRNPFAVIYRADEALSKPADLKGKTVGLNPAGASKNLFRALLATNGIPRSAVKVVSMPGPSLVASLAKQKVDAIVLTNLTALPELSAIGVNARAMLVADWGVHALSEGLVVNTNFLVAHPHTVQSFVRASQEAWVQAEKDPQAAVAAQAAALGPSVAPKGAIGTLRLSFAALHTKLSAGHPIGWMASGDWMQTLQLLKKFYGVKQTLSTSKYYTDRFIAPIRSPSS